MQVMSPEEILHQRLHNQGLVHTRFKNPHDVVENLCAVQAQDFSGAKWGVGLRLKSANDETITEAFNDGRILRTHVMRPTWHFVSPKDIRWMLELTGPRVKKIMNAYNNQLGLSESTFEKGKKVIEKALKTHTFLTRQELKKEFVAEGIQTNVQKLALLVMRAEMDGLITSGPMRGKQFTYALMDERAPRGKIMSREKMVTALVERYFDAHGPATLHDFTWWSGLTLADAKEGVARARGLASVEFNGHPFWHAKNQKSFQNNEKSAFFLPNYDEYTIGYWSKRALYLPTKTTLFSGSGFYHAAVYNGMMVGMWKRSIAKNHFSIQTKLITPLRGSEKEALREAAQKYGAFFGKQVNVSGL
jgi:hypothetical protein